MTEILMNMCAIDYLLAHGTMPLKILILLDFMVQLNIDGMPIKVFPHTAAGLVNMLTIAECTPTDDIYLYWLTTVTCNERPGQLKGSTSSDMA